MKSGLQTELDSFFQIANEEDLPSRVVTKGAFSQARSKLKFQAFVELTDHLQTFFYQNFSFKTFHGFRLLAIDGTTLQLSKSDAITKHFKGLSQSQRPLARASQLYDLQNHITLNASIAPYSTGERELAMPHLSLLTEKDLVLLDRGYPAFWFFAALRAQQSHFCARMGIDHWRVVNQFYQSGQQDAVVSISPSPESKTKCLELGLSTEPFILRLIRIELDNDVTEILATSLLDQHEFPYPLFEGLYHQRWGIEECYKTMKCRIQLENFSGKSVESIYQDFYAKVFTLNLTAAFIHPAQETVNDNNSVKKHPHQVNFTYALSSMKNQIIRLFHRCNPLNLIKHLLLLFSITTEPIRPNRNYPRNPVIRDHPQYFMTYKSVP